MHKAILYCYKQDRPLKGDILVQGGNPHSCGGVLVFIYIHVIIETRLKTTKLAPVLSLMVDGVSNDPRLGVHRSSCQSELASCERETVGCLALQNQRPPPHFVVCASYWEKWSSNISSNNNQHDWSFTGVSIEMVFTLLDCWTETA